MDGHKVLEECVGWGASTILFSTLARQIWVQWHERTVEGVSKWLFVGQLLTSIGFIWYSVLVSNTLFIVTNSVLAGTAVIGQCIYARNKHIERKGMSDAVPAESPGGGRRANALRGPSSN